jgi:hypothetical protein
MKKCVINFARNGWYPAGQRRLDASLRNVGFDGDVLIWSEEQQIGAPGHGVSPYAFKPFALREAARRGYDLVIWADASVWAIRNIEPMFGHLERNGWMLFFNCQAGSWTSDACLASFGVTRDQAMEIPMLMGICMGWNLKWPQCQAFLSSWLEKASDGVTFPGSWTNRQQEVSTDPRVLGHRHDQSAASLIAWRLNMDLIAPDETYFQYYENSRRVSFQSDPDLGLMKPHTVMVAQGM